MTKKMIIGLAMLAVAAPVSNVFAAESGGGCGLGKIILEGKTGKGANLGAALLNQIILPQTFFMSSGTGGCDTTKTVKKDHDRDVFVAYNMDNLQSDIAKGHGEYLSALAEVMHIAEADRSSFYSLTQENYASLFGTSETSSDELLSSLDGIMQADSTMGKYTR